MTYDIASFTARGGRAVNEDSILALNEPDRLLAVVADGLGAHGGGDIASAAAVEAIKNALPSGGAAEEAALTACLREANRAVLANQRPGLSMKTTAVLLAIQNSRAAFAHVGDSRGYHFRGGALAALTTDHSVSQLAVLRGEITHAEIRFHAARSRLLRALGADNEPHGEITPLPAPAPEDAYLLCSDGFWEYITEPEMEADLLAAAGAQAWLAAMLARIEARADERHDNYSAIAVLCGRA